VSANNAVRTPQFWLLWVVLLCNVTAGIGVLEVAAPMIQHFFSGTLFAGMSTAKAATVAAGFVSLLSLANMAGRFVWSSVSDFVGRKNIYRFYLGVGVVLYLILLLVGNASVPLFVLVTMLIMSFYGGGFAALPAYLKDLFGDFQVGAIHGRLLTAWSVAGIAGPLIVDTVSDAGTNHGRTGAALYSTSFTIMIVLLVIGFVANELIKPVRANFHEPTELPAMSTAAPAAAESAVN
jgi:MFS family permease